MTADTDTQTHSIAGKWNEFSEEVKQRGGNETWRRIGWFMAFNKYQEKNVLYCKWKGQENKYFFKTVCAFRLVIFSLENGLNIPNQANPGL